MSSKTKVEKLSIAILAGGQSSRIGRGVFKPIIKLSGKPLLLYVYDNVRELSNEIFVIVKNRQQEKLVKEIIPANDVKIILDSFDFHSPLAGILTAALKSSRDLLVPVGADQIFLSKDTIKNLLHKLDSKTDAVVPKWPNNYIEPLGAVYRQTTIYKFIENTSDNNIKKVSLHDFLQNINVKYVDIYSITKMPFVTYININTLADLKKAKRILANDF